MARIDKELEQTLLELFKLNEIHIVDESFDCGQWCLSWCVAEYNYKYYKIYRNNWIDGWQVVEVKPVEVVETQWRLV